MTRIKTTNAGTRLALATGLLVAAVAAASTPVLAQPLTQHAAPSHATALLTPDVRATLAWVLAVGDHGGQPFMVVDKRQARVFVFNGQGRLLDAAPALLGMTLGDVDVPGVGMKPVSDLTLAERVTPAGRFDTEPGQGLHGDAIVWLDYAAGLAIHRVRPGLTQPARTRSLAAQMASAQRLSLGCVVLSPEFFEAVVHPTLGQHAGVVYILPETQPVQAWLQGGQAARAEP